MRLYRTVSDVIIARVNESLLPVFTPAAVETVMFPPASPGAAASHTR